MSLYFAPPASASLPQQPQVNAGLACRCRQDQPQQQDTPLFLGHERCRADRRRAAACPGRAGSTARADPPRSIAATS